MTYPMAAYSDALDFAYGDYRNALYAYSDHKGNISKGIMFDISQNLAQRVPYQITNINLPRKRTEQFLQSGVVDVRCHLSPNWVEDSANFDWTDSLYTLNTIVITPKNTHESIATIEELQDEVIGTFLGYSYSKELTEFFENKKG